MRPPFNILSPIADRRWLISSFRNAMGMGLLIASRNRGIRGTSIGHRPSAIKKASSSAFTMVELLVVLAIIAVVVTLSVPTIESLSSPKYKLRSEGRKIMKLMTEARSEAMNRKVGIELRINADTREISAVETGFYRTLAQENDPGASDGMDAEEWALLMTNRFHKTIAFDEEWSLEAFSADQINTSTSTQEEDLFPSYKADSFNTEAPSSQQAAVSFSQFGGSDGGGIRLIYNERSLNIATDVLTGRPKLVTLAEGKK